jgi:hypothetical protein
MQYKGGDLQAYFTRMQLKIRELGRDWGEPERERRLAETFLESFDRDMKIKILTLQPDLNDPNAVFKAAQIAQFMGKVADNSSQNQRGPRQNDRQRGRGGTNQGRFPPCKHCGKNNHSQDRCLFNPENKNQQNNSGTPKPQQNQAAQDARPPNTHNNRGGLSGNNRGGFNNNRGGYNNNRGGQNNRGGFGRGQTSFTPNGCRTCGAPGHFSRDCPEQGRHIPPQPNQVHATQNQQQPGELPTNAQAQQMQGAGFAPQPPPPVQNTPYIGSIRVQAPHVSTTQALPTSTGQTDTSYFRIPREYSCAYCGAMGHISSMCEEPGAPINDRIALAIRSVGRPANEFHVNKETRRRPHLHVLMNGLERKVLLDSGAEVAIMSRGFHDQLLDDVRRASNNPNFFFYTNIAPRTLYAANGTTFTADFAVYIPVSDVPGVAKQRRSFIPFLVVAPQNGTSVSDTPLIGYNDEIFFPDLTEGGKAATDDRDRKKEQKSSVTINILGEEQVFRICALPSECAETTQTPPRKGYPLRSGTVYAPRGISLPAGTSSVVRLKFKPNRYDKTTVTHLPYARQEYMIHASASSGFCDTVVTLDDDFDTNPEISMVITNSTEADIVVSENTVVGRLEGSVQTLYCGKLDATDVQEAIETFGKGAKRAQKLKRLTRKYHKIKTISEEDSKKCAFCNDEKHQHTDCPALLLYLHQRDKKRVITKYQAIDAVIMAQRVCGAFAKPPVPEKPVNQHVALIECNLQDILTVKELTEFREVDSFVTTVSSLHPKSERIQKLKGLLPELLKSTEFTEEERAIVEECLLDAWDICKLYDDDRGDTGEEIQMHIDTGDAKPIAQPTRHLPIHLRDKIKQIVDGLLANDIIRPSISPWASPIVPVKRRTDQFDYVSIIGSLTKSLSVINFNYPRSKHSLISLGPRNPNILSLWIWPKASIKPESILIR